MFKQTFGCDAHTHTHTHTHILTLALYRPLLVNPVDDVTDRVVMASTGLRQELQFS